MAPVVGTIEQDPAEELTGALGAKELGDLHRHRREKVGISAGVYARVTGIADEKTVRNWEAGELEKVATVLASLSRLGYTLQRRPDFSPDQLLPAED